MKTLFKKHPWMLFHILFLFIIVGVCFLGPLFYQQDYRSQNLCLGAQAPSLEHPCGTDIMGRDVSARLLYGGRLSIFIGTSASLIAIIIGIIVGSIAGLMGGNTDRFLMRLIDIIYPLPFTLIIILIMSLGGRHLSLLIFAIGCFNWLTLARMIRGQVLCLKNSTFVQSAQCLGQTSFGIWRKHIFPNLMSILFVYGTLLIPNIILEEAFISFLGLGVQPPMSSWGTLIFDGAKEMESAPWLLIFPCLFFSLTLVSLNFLGDHFRDALAPNRKMLQR